MYLNLTTLGLTRNDILLNKRKDMSPAPIRLRTSAVSFTDFTTELMNACGLDRLRTCFILQNGLVAVLDAERTGEKRIDYNNALIRVDADIEEEIQSFGPCGECMVYAMTECPIDGLCEWTPVRFETELICTSGETLSDREFSMFMKCFARPDDSDGPEASEAGGDEPEESGMDYLCLELSSLPAVTTESFRLKLSDGEETQVDIVQESHENAGTLEAWMRHTNGEHKFLVSRLELDKAPEEADKQRFIKTIMAKITAMITGTAESADTDEDEDTGDLLF